MQPVWGYRPAGCGGGVVKNTTSTPNAPSQVSERSGDSLHSDVVRDFEDKITPHILRNWGRERIVRFAKHLLGDACQECQKHNVSPHLRGCSEAEPS